MPRLVGGRALALLALAALIATACAPDQSAESTAPSDASPLVDGSALPSALPSALQSALPSVAVPTSLPGVTPLPISVTDAKYGVLAVRTVAGARCQAALRIAGGKYGDAPPAALPGQSAGADGFLSWTYPSPRVPAGTGGYTISCQSDNSSQTRAGNFTIPTRPISPSKFTVRVTSDAPSGESFKAEPSLVPLRDASVAKMKATLASEWKYATRGLGSLEVVEDSADITMFVIAGHGTSVRRKWLGDDSQDILVYVSGDLGPRNVENNVAVALHELGHIWCCAGPEANDGGHWAEKLTSPGLYGVDKFGIMNEPVLCTQFGAILSCPNRFSDREMVALGFTDFPAPAPDPCIQQGLALRSQIGTTEAQLRALQTQIDRDEATLSELGGQIRAIESQYPAGIPPSIYGNYLSLRSQYNELYGPYSQRVSEYNSALARDRALVAQLNALPCDSS